MKYARCRDEFQVLDDQRHSFLAIDYHLPYKRERELLNNERAGGEIESFSSV